MPIIRPVVRETTGLGSALLAGIAVGVWSGPEDVTRAWREERRFEPLGDASEHAGTRARWKAAIKRA